MLLLEYCDFVLISLNIVHRIKYKTQYLLYFFNSSPPIRRSLHIHLHVNGYTPKKYLLFSELGRYHGAPDPSDVKTTNSAYHNSYILFHQKSRCFLKIHTTLVLYLDHAYTANTIYCSRIFSLKQSSSARLFLLI